MEDTLEYMARIRNAAHGQPTDNWEHELSTLYYVLEYMKQKQHDDETTYEVHTQRLSGENLRSRHLRKRTRCIKITGVRFSRGSKIMIQIPVFGFCSRRNDLNLVNLHQVEEGHDLVIKKCNSYVCLSNVNFRFLDTA